MSLENHDVSEIYQKNHNLRKQDVATLQKWAEGQSHLPKIAEVQLIWFLHSCYYHLEATKTTIEHYFLCRTQNPQLFQFPQGKELEKAFSFMALFILPRSTPDGFSVAMAKLTDPKPENYDNNDFMRIFSIAISLYLKQQIELTKGYLFILDARYTSVGHMMRMPIGALKKIAFYLQEAAPLRIKAVHVINGNPVAYTLLTMIKPFLRKELAEMIHFHSTLESLQKYIPRDCLVEEYGGELPSFLTFNEEHFRNVKANVDFFLWQDSQKIVDTKIVKRESFSYFHWFRKIGGF